MAKSKRRSWTRRITLDGELRRIARGTKDAMDQHYLLWAAKEVKAVRLAFSETPHPAVAELERLYRLEDSRG